jgi:hypothetical protein
MNDSTELTSFLNTSSQRLSSSWTRTCIKQLIEKVGVGDSEFQYINESLVTQGGDKPTGDSPVIWGINIAACYKYCGRQNFPMVFSSPYQHD